MMSFMRNSTINFKNTQKILTNNKRNEVLMKKIFNLLIEFNKIIRLIILLRIFKYNNIFLKYKP